MVLKYPPEVEDALQIMDKDVDIWIGSWGYVCNVVVRERVMGDKVAIVLVHRRVIYQIVSR